MSTVTKPRNAKPDYIRDFARYLEWQGVKAVSPPPPRWFSGSLGVRLPPSLRSVARQGR